MNSYRNIHSGVLLIFIGILVLGQNMSGCEGVVDVVTAGHSDLTTVKNLVGERARSSG